MTLLLSALVFGGALRRKPVLIAVLALGVALGFARPAHLLQAYRQWTNPISYGEYYFGESEY